MKPIPHSVNLELAGLFKHPLRSRSVGLINYASYDRCASTNRTRHMEREFTATVVRVEQQTEEIFLIELESAALNDENPFEIISASLSVGQTGASVGSRLAVTIATGDKVQLVVRPESKQADLGSGRSEFEQESEGTAAQEKVKPVGTFASVEDRVIRTRRGGKIPQDTGDQGGGQN
jgi:hypothetical protein